MRFESNRLGTASTDYDELRVAIQQSQGFALREGSDEQIQILVTPVLCNGKNIGSLSRRVGGFTPVSCDSYGVGDKDSLVIRDLGKEGPKPFQSKAGNTNHLIGGIQRSSQEDAIQQHLRETEIFGLIVGVHVMHSDHGRRMR